MDHGAVLQAELSGRPVLVVRVPNLTESNRTSLRDYVVDSLRLGVLAIGPGVNYSLERFPQLGGVFCCGAESTEGGKLEEPLPGQDTVVAGQKEVLREHGMFQPVLNGKNAQEKQTILSRLRVYRKARGLGCLEEVAREAGTGFTEDLLRGLLTGDSSISIPQWRKLNKALDKLEHSGEVPGE